MSRNLRLFILLMSWGPLSLAAPYGEWGLMGWADTEGIPTNEAQPGMVMPEVGDVDYPPFPGAKVMSVSPGGDSACSMDLRTPAPIEAVCDFYKSKLKVSDGYTNRLRDELSCYLLTEDSNVTGLVVSHNPDPVFASKNGSTQISMMFQPKNNFSCSLTE